MALGNDGIGTHYYIFCSIRSEQATGELHSNENLQRFILKNQLTFIGHFLHAKLCSKCFSSIISINPHSNLMKWKQLTQLKPIAVCSLLDMVLFYKLPCTFIFFCPDFVILPFSGNSMDFFASVFKYPQGCKKPFPRSPLLWVYIISLNSLSLSNFSKALIGVDFSPLTDLCPCSLACAYPS